MKTPKMRASRTTHYLRTLASHPEIILGNSKYLFLISHMRSYSTLISHLLGSSEEINGYKENHLSYRSTGDLIHLRYRTQQAIEARLDGTYILDKILHNHAEISPKMLKKDTIHILFTIRKPVETVKSIINMGSKLVDVEWYRDEDQVAGYYEGRLQKMCEYAKLVGKRGAYLDAEAILNHPEEVVSRLSGWLQLNKPLDTEYQTFKHSGQPFHGDPSKNILEGKIIKKKGSYDIEISTATENRVIEAYKEAKRVIADSCAVLNPIESEAQKNKVAG